MFREMRRKFKEITQEAAVALLCHERRGVLAVNGDDGYPYAVPINYLFDETSGKIYFHGSRVGHKADAIKACDKVCFTVYGNMRIKDEAWAPYLQSVVVFGRCRLLIEPEEAAEACRKFAMKYYPSQELVEEVLAADGKAVQMFEITVEHLSGKEIQER